jgi:hypothetical protein
MTHFLKKLSLSSVALLMLATTASALTPTGPVVQPGETNDSKVFDVAPNWQPFVAEKGDLHWSVASNYLDQAKKRDVIKGKTFNGAALSAETVLMGVIMNVNGGPAKFGADAKGLPTFKIGETYMLPVASAASTTSVTEVVTQPVATTQADLIAQMEKQQARYAAQQSLTETSFASFAANLSGLNGRMDILASSQEELVAKVTQMGRSVASDVNSVRTVAEGAAATADEAKQLAAGVAEDVSTAVTSANQAMVTATETSEALGELTQQLPATVKAAVGAEFDVRTPDIMIAAETAAKTAVKADLDVATTAAADAKQLAQQAADAAKSGNLLTWILSGLLLLVMSVIGVFVFKRLNRHDSAYMQLKNRSNEHEEAVGAISSVVAGVPQWHSSNMSEADLAKLTPANGVVQWKFGRDGVDFVLDIWRNADTPDGLVMTNIVRNAQSQQPADPMSLKNFKVKVMAAAETGRLPPAHKLAIAS